MGNKFIELTDDQKQKIEAYARYGVPMDQVAVLIGVSERTLWNRIKNNSEINALYTRGRLLANVKVARSLFENCIPEKGKRPMRNEDGTIVRDKDNNPILEDYTIRDGKVFAQRFWLSAQAGWRTTLQIEEGLPGAFEDKQLKLDELNEETLEKFLKISELTDNELDELNQHLTDV